MPEQSSSSFKFCLLLVNGMLAYIEADLSISIVDLDFSMCNTK